jgi:hypothetical protein
MTMTREALLAERDRDAARLRAEWVGCANEAEGTCESVKAGEKPDMRLGDICVWCACRECERCGKSIDLDEENRIKDGNRGPAEFQGYWDVCDDCLLDSDVLYDDKGEGE